MFIMYFSSLHQYLCRHFVALTKPVSVCASFEAENKHPEAFQDLHFAPYSYKLISRSWCRFLVHYEWCWP